MLAALECVDAVAIFSPADARCADPAGGAHVHAGRAATTGRKTSPEAALVEALGEVRIVPLVEGRSTSGDRPADFGALSMNAVVIIPARYARPGCLGSRSPRSSGARSSSTCTSGRRAPAGSPRWWWPRMTSASAMPSWRLAARWR